MDKSILICFCFALLTSHLQYVSSESETVTTVSTEERERSDLPKYVLDSITQEQKNQNLLPALSTDNVNELPKSINKSNKDDIKEQLPVLNTYTENVNESTNGGSVTKSIHVTGDTSNSDTNNHYKLPLPPVFIDFESDIEKKSDVNKSSASNTNKNFGLAQHEKPFLPLGNTSADDETTTDTTNKDDDWFYQEKNNDDDDEDYTENEGNKDDSEEYKDEGDDFVLGEHDNDDDDEEYDVTKWTQHGGVDDDDTDWDDETEDDFDESKSHIVDELAKKNKQPTAPTRMVLFYTWMIVAVLLIIVGVSTYQSRCKGFRFFGTKASNPKDDRKRLMEHEFV